MNPHIVKSSFIKTSKDALKLLVENTFCYDNCDNNCCGVMLKNKTFDSIYEEQNLSYENTNLIDIPIYGDIISNIELINYHKEEHTGCNCNRDTTPLMDISEISLVNKETNEVIFSSFKLSYTENGNINVPFMSYPIPLIYMPPLQLKITSIKEYKLIANFIYLDATLRRELLDSGLILQNPGLLDTYFVKHRTIEKIESLYKSEMKTTALNGIFLKIIK